MTRPELADLSGPDPEDPREALALDQQLSDAQRGTDIRRLAALSWAVCNRCDRMVEERGTRSPCCGARMRVQGWAAPG